MGDVPRPAANPGYNFTMLTFGYGCDREKPTASTASTMVHTVNATASCRQVLAPSSIPQKHAPWRVLLFRRDTQAKTCGGSVSTGAKKAWPAMLSTCTTTSIERRWRPIIENCLFNDAYYQPLQNESTAPSVTNFSRTKSHAKDSWRLSLFLFRMPAFKGAPKHGT